MSTAPKRKIQRIKKNSIADLAQILEEEGKKIEDDSLSAEEAAKALRPQIEALRAKGVSFERISQLLRDRGAEIGVATLRKAAVGRRRIAGTGTAGTGKSPASGTS